MIVLNAHAFRILFFYIIFRGSLTAKRKNEGKTPQYCTLDLFMTPPPLKNKQTHKTQTKKLEKKTNIDLAKMVSNCTIYIHIFSKKYIYRRERPPDSHLQEGARSSL